MVIGNSHSQMSESFLSDSKFQSWECAGGIGVSLVLCEFMVLHVVSGCQMGSLVIVSCGSGPHLFKTYSCCPEEEALKLFSFLDLVVAHHFLNWY